MMSSRAHQSPAIVSLHEVAAALLVAVSLLALPAAAQQTPPAGGSTAVEQLRPATPAAENAPAEKEAEGEKDAGQANEKNVLPWMDSVEAGRRDALVQGRPLLVRVVSDFCPWCKVLDKEIAHEEVQRELRRWSLVTIDIDKSRDDVRRLAVTATPALRVLTPLGRVVAAHEGFLEAEELTKWLEQHHDEAFGDADAVLLGEGKPSLLDAVRLVRQFDQRDAAVREAAARRLEVFPEVARAPVVKALREGNLATRLTAREILESWRAPVAELDPWRPETFTEERLAKVDAWVEEAAAAQDAETTEPAGPPTEAQLADAREAIDKMLQSDPAGAVAVRERLARFGEHLLPEVTQRLHEATDDTARQRLLALRYRLAADDALVLRWPGGLERLADGDPGVRHQAAAQLAAQATAADQPLLLELFADPDPLVRELSLRGLRQIGGKQATAALVRLLEDPEPNVRAAVLKQLAEDAPAEMLDEVAQYVKQEQDSDLLVHAIRYLRELKSPEVVDSLMPLLSHESWQVRAEAAEAAGKWVQHDYNSQELAVDKRAELNKALVKLLEDPDAFVVSRAVTSVAKSNTEEAVEPLVQAAAEHPSLAPTVVQALAGAANLREQVLPHLHEFARSERPSIRAAAIEGLVTTAASDVEDEMLAALVDEDRQVRIAAAASALRMLEAIRRKEQQEQADLGKLEKYVVEEPTIIAPPPSPAQRLLQGALRLFGGGESSPKTGDGEMKSEDAEKERIEKNGDSEKPRDPFAVPAEHRPLTQPTDNNDEAPPDTTRPKQDPADKKTTENTPAADESADEENAPQKESAAEGETKEQETGDGAKENKYDEWLEEFYAGQHRPEWTAKMVEPLQSMLASEDRRERVTAAVALLPLGHADQAVPLLLGEAEQDVEAFNAAAGTQHWLLGPRRRKLVRRLLELAGSEDELRQLAYGVQESSSERETELMWQLLALPQAGKSLAETVRYSLQKMYYGDRYYDRSSITDRRRSEVAAALRPHAESGTTIGRLVAMNLLMSASADDAREIARRWLDDESAAAELRTDAFQILLAAQSKSERKQTALAAIAGEDPHRRKVALAFLTKGDVALRKLAGSGFELSIDSEVTFSTSENSIPAPPEQLEPEQLRPLLDDPDGATAAYAGYLLALMGERDGLASLLEFWRAQPTVDGALDKLVYQAIAVLDDSEQIPVLKKIYARLSQYQRGDFYWTVRSMTGDEILQFRQQIRDEVGMSNLR